MKEDKLGIEEVLKVREEFNRIRRKEQKIPEKIESSLEYLDIEEAKFKDIMLENKDFLKNDAINNKAVISTLEMIEICKQLLKELMKTYSEDFYFAKIFNNPNLQLTRKVD